MIEDLTLVRNMVLAVATGYLLGALPFAHIASRIRGIDVFATGSTLAGTANVFFNVGHRTGALVLVGDVAKGAAAVFAAWALGVSPALILVAGGIVATEAPRRQTFPRFRPIQAETVVYGNRRGWRSGLAQTGGQRNPICYDSRGAPS